MGLSCGTRGSGKPGGSCHFQLGSGVQLNAPSTQTVMLVRHNTV
jgi:hypothetical protein